MTIYDDARAVALNLFAEFQQGKIEYVTSVPGEGSTPDDPSDPVEQRVTIDAVARPVSTKYVDGSNVLQSDVQVAMPNIGVEPTPDGYLAIDGKSYKIIDVMARPSAGTVVTYIVIVRR